MLTIEHQIHNVRVTSWADRVIEVLFSGMTNVTVVLKAEIGIVNKKRKMRLFSVEIIDDNSAGLSSFFEIQKILETKEWDEFADRLIKMNFPLAPSHTQEEEIKMADVVKGDLIRVESWSKGMKHTREGVARSTGVSAVYADEYNTLVNHSDEINGAIITRVTFR